MTSVKLSAGQMIKEISHFLMKHNTKSLDVHFSDINQDFMVQFEHKWDVCKKYKLNNNTKNWFMIGQVILHLVKLNIFDRIIYLKLDARNDAWRKAKWWECLRPLLSDEFTSLIQFHKIQYTPIDDVAYFDLLCQLISRDKLIYAPLALGKIYNAQKNKWSIYRNKLISAIMSTNTLKTISIGGPGVSKCEQVLHDILKQALQVNFSVTVLQYYDADFQPNRASEDLLMPEPVKNEYQKWWPMIKKRNKESFMYNKILFGDAKDDATWNNKKCPQKIAKIIASKHLNLPKEFFNSKQNLCFCRKCHSKRKDEMVYSRGSPRKRYGVPLEWVRFGLKTDEGKCMLNKVFATWHVGFHGTSKDVVFEIFKSGLILLKPGDYTMNGTKLKMRTGHINVQFNRHNKYTKRTEKFDPNQIFVSPSVRYAGHEAYAKPFYCSHPQNKDRTLKVQFAFQLRIRPGSYNVGQETVGAARIGKTLDAHFSNNEIEWYTKENLSIVLYGLLLKITEINVPLQKYKKTKSNDDEKKKKISDQN
eukprot:244078_1